MKRMIFELQVTGLGDNEDEARNDAVEQLSNTIHDHVEISSWLTLKSTEDVDDDEDSC